MMRNICRFFVLLCLIGYVYKCDSQTVIPLEKDGGVYKVPCVVNGLRLKLIFDTGASNVCVSQTVASMMLENDYLSINDIMGSSQSQVADGRIVGNTKINIKKIQIGDKVLTNVEAVVIHGQDAPLLLGQSALKRLGRYSISGDKLIFGTELVATRPQMYNNESRKWLYNKLTKEGYDMGDYPEFNRTMDNNLQFRRWCFDHARKHGYNVGKDFDEFESLVGPQSTNKQINIDKGRINVLSDDEIDLLFKEAQEAYKAKTYHVALEKYTILNDNGLLNAYGKMMLADCYYYTQNYEKARNIYMSLQSEMESDAPVSVDDLAWLYLQIGHCLEHLEDYDAAIPYFEKARIKASPYSVIQHSAVYFTSYCYNVKGDKYSAMSIMDDYVSQYLSYKKMRATDCWDRGFRDKFLGELYYERYLCASSEDIEKYLVIAAAWGYEDAIENCNKLMIEFRVKPRKYIYK